MPEFNRLYDNETGRPNLHAVHCACQLSQKQEFRSGEVVGGGGGVLRRGFGKIGCDGAWRIGYIAVWELSLRLRLIF